MSSTAKTFRIVGVVLILIFSVWALSLKTSGQTTTGSPQISEEAALARQLAGGGSINPIDGYSVFSVVGYNPSVGNTYESMWSRGGAQPLPPKTGLLMAVRSTSTNDISGGTGARQVTITCHGVGAVPFVESIAMTGTSLSIEMAAVCVRVIIFGVVDNGILATNDGTITLENGGVVYSEIPVIDGLGLGVVGDGTGFSLSANYSCPVNRVCVVTRALWTTGDNQAIFTAGFAVDLLATGRQTVLFEISGEAEINLGQCFPPGTDISIVAKVPTGTAPLTVTYRVHEIVKSPSTCPPGRAQIGVS